MHKVRWGVLSTAKIGMKKVLPAIMKSEICEVRAIASRSRESSARAAAELGIPVAHESYEALLIDPEIDAVYIPLPNHLHVEWAMKGIDAGKHVLCEKPVGLDSVQARRLLEHAAKHPELKVMEAFMYRFHPQWVEARRIANSGEIGEVRCIQSFFSYFNDDPDNIRNSVAAGGGGLMDIGCYCISLSRFIFDAEPDRVCGLADVDPKFGTDRMFTGMMDFDGRVSSFSCSTQLEPYQRVNILGTRGRVEILIPFNAPPDEACEIVVYADEKPRSIKTPPCDQYTLQADLFARAILDDTPVPTPLFDALDNMLAIETLMDSARDGGWKSLLK